MQRYHMSTYVGNQKYIETIEILQDILNIVAKTAGNNNSIVNVSKKEIMSKTKLSNAELEEYLSALLKNGILNFYPRKGEDNDDSNSYSITEKGMYYLQMCGCLINYIST
jgi:predicted transcriptional regulator